MSCCWRVDEWGGKFKNQFTKKLLYLLLMFIKRDTGVVFFKQQGVFANLPHLTCFTGRSE